MQLLFILTGTPESSVALLQVRLLIFNFRFSSLFIDPDLQVAEINVPKYTAVRMLELADFVTDVLTAIVVGRRVNNSWFLLLLVLFSLSASSIVNLYRCYTHIDDNQTYLMRRKRAALGLALIAFEDLIMIPVNLILVIYDLVLVSAGVQTFNLASLLDNSLVLLSAFIGFLTISFKLSSGCTDVFCGNKGYEGDLHDLDEFLKNESGPARPSKTDTCRFLDWLSQMY